MLALLNSDLTPPGGWTVLDRHSGKRITANTYSDLLAAVKSHRRANNLPIGTAFEDEIQNDLCSALPPTSKDCYECEGSVTPPPVPRGTTIDDAIRFIQTMGAALKSGAGFVSQEEAERRAEICAGCEFNVRIGGCSSCRNLVKWVTGTIGGRHTSKDADLKGCAHCGCENRVAVHIDLAAQQSSLTETLNAQLPDFCWKKRQDPTP